MLEGIPDTELGADVMDVQAAGNFITVAGVALTSVGVEGKSGEKILPLPGPLEADGGRVRD